MILHQVHHRQPQLAPEVLLVGSIVVHLEVEQFAAQSSYHCNSLNFQHNVKCDTSKQKWDMCRGFCTGQL